MLLLLLHSDVSVFPSLFYVVVYCPWIIMGFPLNLFHENKEGVSSHYLPLKCFDSSKTGSWWERLRAAWEHCGVTFLHCFLSNIMCFELF